MAEFEWKYPETPKDDAMYEMIVRTFGDIGRTTMEEAEVRAPVAISILTAANIRNDPNRSPSEMMSYIEVSKGDISDAFINLVADGTGAAWGINEETGAMDAAWRS